MRIKGSNSSSVSKTKPQSQDVEKQNLYLSLSLLARENSFSVAQKKKPKGISRIGFLIVLSSISTNLLKNSFEEVSSVVESTKSKLLINDFSSQKYSRIYFLSSKGRDINSLFSFKK